MQEAPKLQLFPFTACSCFAWQGLPSLCQPFTQCCSMENQGNVVNRIFRGILNFPFFFSLGFHG